MKLNRARHAAERESPIWAACDCFTTFNWTAQIRDDLRGTIPLSEW